MVKRIKEIVFGKPRDVRDPKLFHNVSLIAFLAWVGLGADGLSSSAYGPDEAYRALGPHTHMAPLLVLMTAVTIAVISIAYSNLIQHFPGGGGGYLVASKLLGPKVGVVSGCALLVDYMLTISVSIASACDALWSFLPPHLTQYKLLAEFGLVGGLIILNLRGVRESVTLLAPIFMVFVISHVVMIAYAIGTHMSGLPTVFHGAAVDLHSSIRALGFIPMALILLKAYSMGGGTYTGIEAVSNGLSVLREPRVETGKKTMFLMAISLAVTAGGILFGYLLVNAQPVEGKTMNAVLLETLFVSWHVGRFAAGKHLVVLILASEAAILIVAAQAGFLDGPRILANMAIDSWMPRRFSELSNRLVAKNGVLLMGAAALATLLYTRGDITTLVVMYSINVFVTFSLTELGMARHWIVDRHKEPRWKSQLAIHGTGLVMCLCILTITLYEKFGQGGWVTTVITTIFIALSFAIHQHYENVKRGFQNLDDVLLTLPKTQPAAESPELDRKAWTAILTVPSFSGYGLHHLLSIRKIFPNQFTNVVFVSVGVIDSGNFKGREELSRLEEKVESDMQRYLACARQFGLKADYRVELGTESMASVERLCRNLSAEFPNSVVFAGKLIFRKERWYQRALHSETAVSLQRRLQLDGIPAMILPIRA